MIGLLSRDWCSRSGTWGSSSVVLGLLVGCLAAVSASAGNPPLDYNSMADWPSAEGGDLTFDGRYGLYIVSHHHEGAPNALIVRALHGGWEVKREVLGPASFTRDGRMAVFIDPSHTLCLVTLGTSISESIPNVRAYRLVRQKGGEWLVYRTEGRGTDLVVRDVAGKRIQAYADVGSYWFSDDGEVLVLQTTETLAEANREAGPQTLRWVRLAGGSPVTIWRGIGVSDVTFDATSAGVAWMSADEGGGADTKALWYYRGGADKATRLLDHHAAGIDDHLQVAGIAYPGFSADSSRIFITLKAKPVATPRPGPDAVRVDIWSYKDPTLQSQQLKELASTNSTGGDAHGVVAVVPIHSPHVIRLEQDNEKIEFPGPKVQDAALLWRFGGGSSDERNWNSHTSVSWFLVSTKTGARTPLTLQGNLSLSPDSNYIVAEDYLQGGIWSYEIATGMTHDLSSEIPIPVDADYDENPLPPTKRLLRVEWIDHDQMLIEDQYDLWRLDLTGQRPPFNLTRGYGRRHHIKFQLANSDRGQHRLLKAFSYFNKESGYFSQTLGSRQDPKRLSMGPYRYELMDYITSGAAALPTFGSATHLVQRESASEAPNFFYTRDFKTFFPLSQVHPERAYNWLTTQLLTWNTPDGRVAQGVLYKPENFDPAHQYPVIFHYYEKLSDQLNQYRPPTFMINNLPIAWFVSHGYLVFTPDIHYTIGHLGRSAVDTVVSAAQYLARFPWVDARKMGLQGHSWGGFETNYIVTHTDVFAAAMSSSGMSDAVSDYDGLMDSGGSRQFFYELDQCRIGPTLWQRPDLYLENSPVLAADKVKTPLLMMNNKGDSVVPFAQGVEFFVALRRLGKKAWMLQYDGEDHSLQDEQAARQHTIRVTQFFDYYLKGAPPPKWMTEGVPAKLKGVEDGLELDSSGAIP